MAETNLPMHDWKSANVIELRVPATLPVVDPSEFWSRMTKIDFAAGPREKRRVPVQ